jgi:hypothetical protein
LNQASFGSIKADQGKSRFGQVFSLCSQGKKKMERVKGIEPSYQAWEARVLPLNYTRSRRRWMYQSFRRMATGLHAKPRLRPSSAPTIARHRLS